uniref:Uncharacterized protein n=1 Tax=Rhizophora mucronata TaxID=61149 RepID=A0A2P2N9M9_RHIMU
MEKELSCCAVFYFVGFYLCNKKKTMKLQQLQCFFP